MNSHFVALCAMFLLATGVNGGPISAVPAATVYHPQYAFNYDINDPSTSDKKAQWELRDGGNVKGSYSLNEPDGSSRVVDYLASDLAGFNAFVKMYGPSFHPATPLVAKSIGPMASVVGPINYGFGAAQIAPVLPSVISLGHWSLPWDPLTHSFGGWIPLTGPLTLPSGPTATVFSKKVVNGRVHRWTTGPISLVGHTLVIKKKHG